MSPAKNEEMNNEKTANKIITNEEVWSNLSIYGLIIRIVEFYFILIR